MCATPSHRGLLVLWIMPGAEMQTGLIVAESLRVILQNISAAKIFLSDNWIFFARLPIRLM